jgi:hypothetical protein
MKTTIKKEQAPKHFIQVPQRDSNIFQLKSHLFKFYVWLLSHNDGYKFTEYYMCKGVGTDARTIKKNLTDLNNLKWIEIIQLENEMIIKCKYTGISVQTNSVQTNSVQTNSVQTNSVQTNSPETINSSPQTYSTNSPQTYIDSSLETYNSSLETENSSPQTNEVYQEVKQEEKQKKENQKKEENLVEENFSQFCVEDSLEILKYNNIQFKSKNKFNIGFSEFEEYYVMAIIFYYYSIGILINSNQMLQDKILNTKSELIPIKDTIDRCSTDVKFKTELLDIANKFKL